jgi:hypothetical protein
MLVEKSDIAIINDISYFCKTYLPPLGLTLKRIGHPGALGVSGIFVSPRKMTYNKVAVLGSLDSRPLELAE